MPCTSLGIFKFSSVLPVAWTMHSLAGSELGCGSEVLDSDLTWQTVEDCGKWEAHRWAAVQPRAAELFGLFEPLGFD